MKKLKLNIHPIAKIKQIVLDFIMNHPELSIDIDNLREKKKNFKFTKHTVFKIVDELLEWTFIAGICMLLFVLFLGVLFKTEIVIAALCIGIFLTILPCIVALEYIRHTDNKKNSKNN